MLRRKLCDAEDLSAAVTSTCPSRVRSARLKAAGALLAFCALSIQNAPAEEPAAPASSNDCDFNAPTAMLVGSAYPDYQFTAKANNESSETIALDKGVRFELRQSACVDAVDQELLITIAHPKHAAGDVKFWADFALQVLAKLKTQEGASGAMQSFATFIAQAPSHKPHKGKMLWCRDGTETPDQECGWSTGGVYLFEIRREGAALVIDAAQSTSG